MNDESSAASIDTADTWAGTNQDGDESCSSNSRSTVSSSSAKSLPIQQLPLQECADEYTAEVQQWAQHIPIGLGLCPWAIKSQKQGRIKYVTCEGSTSSVVGNMIVSEAKLLCEKDVLPLSTTLIVCPFVSDWNDNFHSFDNFVKDFQQQLERFNSFNSIAMEQITLVPFHPNFVRWRGLPKDVSIGSKVRTHRGMAGFSKSIDVFPATIIEPNCSTFGARKVKVQFEDDGKHQYVPIDWLDLDTDGQLGDVLPDNAMHQAPYATIHLIRNEDLGSLCARDVSRVKRKNAMRMMRNVPKMKRR